MITLCIILLVRYIRKSRYGIFGYGGFGKDNGYDDPKK